MNLLIITELPAQIPGASPDFWDRLVSEQGVMVTMVFATFLFVLAAGNASGCNHCEWLDG